MGDENPVPCVSANSLPAAMKKSLSTGKTPDSAAASIQARFRGKSARASDASGAPADDANKWGTVMPDGTTRYPKGTVEKLIKMEETFAKRNEELEQLLQQRDVQLKQQAKQLEASSCLKS